MSALVNAEELLLLRHLLQNADWTAIGDATGLRGSSTPGSFYLALFTADPGETGSVAAEATYTGYARKAIARNATKWVVDGNDVENGETEEFAACTGGSNLITWFAVCKAGTASVADIVAKAQLTASRTISSGITPRFQAGTLVFSAD